MFTYQKKNNNVSEKTINIFLNNFDNARFIDVIIDLVTYIISVSNLIYIPKLTLITLYPKFYVRTIMITREIDIYTALDKIFRNNKNISLMTSVDNIPNDTMISIDTFAKNIQESDITIIADSDALFMRDLLKHIKTKIGFYCHTLHSLDDNTLHGFKEVQIKKGKSFLYNNISKNTVCNVLSNILNMDKTNESYIHISSLFFKDLMIQLSGADITEILIPDDLMSDNLKKHYDIDNKTEINELYTLILSLLSDVRYILSLNINEVSTYHVDTLRKIINIDNKSTSYKNNKTYNILTKSLHCMIQDILSKHSLVIYKTNTINESESNNISDKIINDIFDNHDNVNIELVKKCVESIKHNSAHIYGNTYRYICKKIDTTNTHSMYAEIKRSGDRIADQIDDIEEIFQDTIIDDDSDMYITALTMSDWTDELRRYDCVGLALSLYKYPYEKGRYTLLLNSDPMCVGSMGELFHTIRSKTIEINGPINVDNNVIISNNELNMVCNCVVPLYIHKIHWDIAKKYLNTVCNLIMYNSLVINDSSAWKIMYTIFMHVGCRVINNKNINRTTKYMFSIWLTNHILSREYKYNKGLCTFLSKLVNDSKFQNNVDPVMLSGQIICVGLVIDLQSMNMICGLLIRNKLAMILKEDIYVSNDFVDDIIDESTARKVDAEKFINTIKNYTDTFDMIHLLHVFKIFFEKIQTTEICSSLKQNFGIPTKNILKLFENSINLINRENIIMDTILHVDYGIISVNNAIVEYREMIQLQSRKKVSIVDNKIIDDICSNKLSEISNSNQIDINALRNNNNYMEVNNDTLNNIVDKIMSELCS
jgi:hypothetical protein